MQADPTNGYVCVIQVYTGKEGQQSEHGLGYRVFSDLVRDLHGENYQIFCDNFFTSVRLAEDLLSNNLYLCGTTHSNQTDFPANLKPNKAEVKALCRGESLFRHKGGIVATVWKDKKLVSFLSTQCEVQGNETVSKEEGRYIYSSMYVFKYVSVLDKQRSGGEPFVVLLDVCCLRAYIDFYSAAVSP